MCIIMLLETRSNKKMISNELLKISLHKPTRSKITRSLNKKLALNHPGKEFLILSVPQGSS